MPNGVADLGRREGQEAGCRQERMCEERRGVVGRSSSHYGEDLLLAQTSVVSGFRSVPLVSRWVLQSARPFPRSAPAFPPHPRRCWITWQKERGELLSILEKAIGRHHRAQSSPVDMARVCRTQKHAELCVMTSSGVMVENREDQNN